jgi:CheY-like chemotaxis protein
LDLRILLVEDNADDAELVLRRLRSSGFVPQSKRVSTADDLLAALPEAWDLALVDYDLPGFGGHEALRLLAERAPDLPAITVSGAISEETAVATLTAGAVDYVLKDNLTRLAPAVRRAVEGAELSRRQRSDAEQARRTQFAIDHASQTIAYVAQDGTVLYANSAAEQLSRAPLDTIVGRPIWRWSPGATAETTHSTSPAMPGSSGSWPRRARISTDPSWPSPFTPGSTLADSRPCPRAAPPSGETGRPPGSGSASRATGSERRSPEGGQALWPSFSRSTR